MYVDHVTLVWIAAYIFTILSFYRRDVLLFPLLAAAHFFFLGLFVQDIDFVGFGSTNIITWTADIYDFGGLIGLPTFFSGIGLVMVAVALYNALLISRKGAEAAMTGKAFDWRNM